MFAKDATQAGSLVMLLERGTDGCRPDVWCCSQWSAAGVYQRLIYRDIIGRPPTPQELAHDMVEHPDMWVHRQLPASAS